MKKTTLALAVTSLFAATTVHSALIYDKDGVKVDIYGDVEVNFQSDINPGANDDVYLNVDDADFGFKLGHDLGNGFTIGGVLEISAESGNAALGDAFVGVMSDKYGTLTAGNQATIFDDAGIGADYQFGFNSFYEQDDASHQVIKYKLDTGTFYGGIAYLMANEVGMGDDTSVVDANIGARFAGFDLTAFYGVGENTAISKETSNMNFEVRYAISAFELAAAYAISDITVAGLDTSTDSIGLTGVYSLDKASFAVGYAMFSSDDATEDLNQYYINASYAVTDYVNTYVEIGGNDADDSEVGFAAGMQVNF